MAYFSVIAAVLILMNTYLLTASRDMIFSSKEAFVLHQASIISASLEAYDSPGSEDIQFIMKNDVLDIAALNYIVIADEAGGILYDPKFRTLRDDYPFDFVSRTLEGYDIFYAEFSEGTFSSSAFRPVIRDGVPVGVIHVHDEDDELGAILMKMQSTLLNISVIVGVFSVAIILLIVWFVMRRITSILKAIGLVREGEYSYRVGLSGHDELAILGDEFNRLTDRLKETDEVRKRFVTNASHELKTPLASIKLLSDSILQNEGIEPEKAREFVGDIGTEAERLARTTEKLMSLTRLDAHIPNNNAVIDVRELVKSAMRRLSHLANSMGVALKEDLGGSCHVLATEDSIDQIIYNLIENAIKYNSPNGKVMVELKTEGKEVVLGVEDTGVGIPEEDMPYIFDRFYRVDKARAREAGGSGLGLAIVLDTVRELGGKVTANNRKSGGMRFEVRFKKQ